MFPLDTLQEVISLDPEALHLAEGKKAWGLASDRRV